MIKFGQKLKSSDERNYFITSDLHFFHKRILDFCSETRPWQSLEEMHETLIEHWNSKVSPEDVVFHLGDFSFVAKEKTQEIMSKLNGNVVWIAGNHDYKVFNQIGNDYQHYLEVNFDGKKICMSHYPITAWNQQGRGSLHVHGHTHGSFQGNGKLHDVSWDNNGRILTLQEFVDIADSKEVYCPDHHKVI